MHTCTHTCTCTRACALLHIPQMQKDKALKKQQRHPQSVTVAHLGQTPQLAGSFAEPASLTSTHKYARACKMQCRCTNTNCPWHGQQSGEHLLLVNQGVEKAELHPMFEFFISGSEVERGRPPYRVSTRARASSSAHARPTTLPRCYTDTGCTVTLTSVSSLCLSL